MDFKTYKLGTEAIRTTASEDTVRRAVEDIKNTVEDYEVGDVIIKLKILGFDAEEHVVIEIDY
ncbi:hypothetical protein [Bacillus sp. NEAU-Y102]